MIWREYGSGESTRLRESACVHVDSADKKEIWSSCNQSCSHRVPRCGKLLFFRQQPFFNKTPTWAPVAKGTTDKSRSDTQLKLWKALIFLPINGFSHKTKAIGDTLRTFVRETPLRENRAGVGSGIKSLEEQSAEIKKSMRSAPETLIFPST